jgi:zona occludens toxin (predicted ATPase)
MKSKTKIIIIIVLVVVVIGIIYYYMSSSAAAAAPASSANPSASDAQNIATITAWIGSMPPGSAQQTYWQSVLASASSSTLSQWVACINAFNGVGPALTASQQSFWNNLAQGH